MKPLDTIRIAFASVLLSMPALAAAQDFPTRPVKLVTPYASGGATDILARTLAQKLSELWGQQVLVENKPGASGVLGTEFVKTSPPDGYTVQLGTLTTHVLNPILLPTAKYDGLKDFAPLATMANSPFVLVVTPKINVRNTAELIALMKAQPGKLNFGSSGIGTSNHLAGELFKAMAGADMVHVPYKGGTGSLLGLLQNEIQVQFDPLPSTAIAQVKQGALVALATTGKRRSRALPELPTVAESGLPGYEAGAWYGFFVPAATPRAVTQKLSADIVRAVDSPDVQAKLGELGAEPLTLSSPAFVELIQRDRDVWAKLIRERGIKVGN